MHIINNNCVKATAVFVNTVGMFWFDMTINLHVNATVLHQFIASSLQEKYNNMKADYNRIEGENLQLQSLCKQKEQEVIDANKVSLNNVSACEWIFYFEKI